MTNISIPKEVIYFSIGTVLVVLIGLIASNMYLQEMLLFEGVEKSIPLFTEEELREYGSIYKEMTIDFDNEIGYLIEDYANRTNRAGERIHYGIYNHEHPIDDTGKIKAPAAVKKRARKKKAADKPAENPNNGENA